MSSAEIKIKINGPKSSRFKINNSGSYESDETVSVICVNAGFLHVTTTPDSQWSYNKEV